MDHEALQPRPRLTSEERSNVMIALLGESPVTRIPGLIMKMCEVSAVVWIVRRVLSGL